ncbi:hypothetical protein [Clostridioides sp. ZZV15-6388]
MNNSNTTISEILVEEYTSRANEGYWRVSLTINTKIYLKIINSK